MLPDPAVSSGLLPVLAVATLVAPGGVIMDLDDLFDGIGFDISRSKRAQWLIRVLFGLLGTALSAAGAWHMRDYDASLHFRLAAVALFVFLGAFFLVNVTLLRKASWPWKGLVAAFVMLFVVRIVFGP